MSAMQMELPRELRHRQIREVRDVSAPVEGREAYQIVFDQHFQPYDWWNPVPEGWEMTYARVEWHNDHEGWLAKLLPDKECLCVVVRND